MVECNLAKVDVAGSSPVSRFCRLFTGFFLSCCFARVAQLDRALASEAKGRGFDSRLAHFAVVYGFYAESRLAQCRAASGR